MGDAFPESPLSYIFRDVVPLSHVREMFLQPCDLWFAPVLIAVSDSAAKLSNCIVGFSVMLLTKYFSTRG